MIIIIILQVLLCMRARACLRVILETILENHF